MTDEVVALVADNRRAPNHRQQPEQRQRLAGRRGCERGREQQRITGQEQEEHHARFDEYDEEDESEGRRHARMAIQPAIAARGSFQQFDDE